METITVAIISSVSVFLASLIPQLIANSQNKKNNLYRSSILYTLKLLNQIQAFYILENMYAQEIAKIQNKNQEGIRREFRALLAESEESEGLFIDSDLTSPAKVKKSIQNLTERLE